MKLNVRKIRELTTPGRYADGGGLYLHVRAGGSRQWLLRTMVRGKRSDIGLGSCELVSLAEAREKALEMRKAAREGGDPLADRQRERNTLTFEKAARIVWQEHIPTWKEGRHIQNWIRSFEDTAFPKIGSKRMEDINSADILDVLSPIWTKTPEAARKLRQRLRLVFDWAKAAGHRSGDNPVMGIKLALPKHTERVRHHPALEWEALPDFMVQLVKREAVSAEALVFLILTAARSSEVRLSMWHEIDGNEWIIPASRMKMKREHKVPLSTQTRAILDTMRCFSDDLIFPGAKQGKPFSDMAFKALFKRMGYDTITAHGFRSTFRDWVSDNAVASREVAEAALAHQVGDETERAYARSDLFERRRKLMQTWADYAYSKV